MRSSETGVANRTPPHEHGRSAVPESAAEALATEWAAACRVTEDQLGTALREDGCPLCRVAAHVAERLYAAMLETRHLPPLTEQQVHRAQGLCEVHARAVLDAARLRSLPAEGLGRTLLGVLGAARAALQLYGAQPDPHLDPAVFKRTIRYHWTKNVARKLAPSGLCPLCLILKRVDEAAGYDLLALLGRADVRSAYGPRAALCLPHFRWVLDHAAEKVVLDCVVKAEEGRLAALEDASSREMSSALCHLVGHLPSLRAGSR